MAEGLKISVIVPVYNAEDYLCECIESILSQSYTDFELILVDDGSTDSSSIICDEYSVKDKRVFTCHGDNKGVSAMNDKSQRSDDNKTQEDREVLPKNATD